MRFDWQRFVDQYKIDYVTSGPNVAKGHINVRCPFCGSADPSHHMGLSLNGEGWGCWRRSDHRGGHPARLIAALLNIPLARAHQLVGDDTSIPQDFASQVHLMLDPKSDEDHRHTLIKLPEEFKTFRQRPSFKPFYNYLKKRGFTSDEIWRMSSEYDLHYCTRGPYKGRIIFPVYFEERLVSWTGRTIHDRETLRYRALTVKPEVAERDGTSLAEAPISHYLLWYDDLLRADADTLVLVEGPFDSLKIEVLGRDEGIVSTCFFTSAPTEQQLSLLHELIERYRYRYLLLDEGSTATAMNVGRRMAALDIEIKSVPRNVKDPGNLVSTRQLLKILRD